MPKPQPPAATVLTWLQANLGPRCLAPLTSTDTKALQAAVQLVELYTYDRDDSILNAFRWTVLRMQPHCRELAFHAIAHVRDWSDRHLMWSDAGLSPIQNLRRCKHE